jgi:pyridinium-3,5-bisthiocarboxylic acid mononucleotide nickel chelatase
VTSAARSGRVAWFNCQAGVAGDMTLAALVDAGADPAFVADVLNGLGIDGFAVTFERVQRCGVGATWANVVTHAEFVSAHTDDAPISAGQNAEFEEHDHAPHRPVREIFQLLDDAALPDRVRIRSRAVFERLAEVEGAIHGVDPADVELHEVGSLDAIVDVVGVCAALESLAVDEVRCSPIAIGTGSIRSAHGTLPNPAPATVALLLDASAPCVGIATTLEVTTPTGAALMTTLATSFGATPAMVIDAVGYGAGTADVAERANVVQVVVGSSSSPAAAIDESGAAVTLLEVNVDDTTGEVLAFAVAALLAAGAHDAWIVPIVMKKGRSAHTVSVLCEPVDAARMRGLLVEHSGSLGVRASSLIRWPQRRTMSSVDVAGHMIGVKISDRRVKVEFDDAARASIALGRPVAEIISRAEAAARSQDAT